MISWGLFRKLSYFQIFKVLRNIALVGILAAAAYYMDRNGGEDLILASTICYILAILAALDCLLLVFKLIPKILTYLYVVMRAGTQKGSAGWADQEHMNQSGLFKRGRNFLVGLYLKQAVFLSLETSGLVVSPTGGGKTSCFVVNVLCSNPENMIVTDLKANLAEMTVRFREKKFGHRGVVIDLAGSRSVSGKYLMRYNLLQGLINDWINLEHHGRLFSDAYEVAYILVPEAEYKSTNDFFPNASRKFFVFCCLYLLVTTDTVSLPQVLVLLSDLEELKSAVAELRHSSLLKGDLARLASDLWTKMEDAKPEQLESFREGMLQPLEIFSPSSALADVISESDFSFSEMRKKKMTVYIIPDPTRPKAFKKAIELLTWNAFSETMRQPNGRKIVFMLDEAGNFQLPNLPTYQTLAREYQIGIVIILQDLEQWARAYGGQAAVEILLSQCEWKVFMGSPESIKTCNLVSNYLGEGTEKQINYSLGKTILDPISTSVSEVPRRLMTPDEVRRNKGIIVVLRGEKPVYVEPVGYNNISPMKWQVGINPYFGKPYRGKTRLWLINWPWL